MFSRFSLVLFLPHVYTLKISPAIRAKRKKTPTRLGLALGQVADGVSAGKRHLARDELVVGRLGDQELDLHATADLRILRILRQKLFTADVDLLPLLHLGCKEGIRSKSM